MSIGYTTILKLRQIERECAEMGFRLGYPSHGYAIADLLAVMPSDDNWPIYTRNAELFIGNIDELEKWMQGAKWMQDYLRMIRLVSKDKIKKKEDDIRHNHLIAKLKAEKIALKGNQ